MKIQVCEASGTVESPSVAASVIAKLCVKFSFVQHNSVFAETALTLSLNDILLLFLNFLLCWTLHINRLNNNNSRDETRLVLVPHIIAFFGIA